MLNVKAAETIGALTWRVRRWRECRQEVRRAAAGPAPPVLIYQMAKGGSSTVLKALERAGVNAFRAHLINPDTARRFRALMREKGLSVLRMDIDLIGGAVYRGIIRPGLEAKVITWCGSPSGGTSRPIFRC